MDGALVKSLSLFDMPMLISILFFFLSYLFTWVRQALVAAPGTFVASCGFLHCGTQPF